jgi:hypothetical protein
MTTSLGILEYAGQGRSAPRGFFGACGSLIRFTVVLAVLIVFVTLRAAVLLAGVSCVFVGTVLLMLGGKRDAARRLAAWRERSLDLMGLWWSDITRPLRRSTVFDPQAQTRRELVEVRHRRTSTPLAVLPQ